MHRWSDRLPERVTGMVLLSAGVVLFILGMNASDSAADRWSRLFTGHLTDATVLYLVGGVAAGAVGVVLLMLGRRSTTA